MFTQIEISAASTPDVSVLPPYQFILVLKVSMNFKMPPTAPAHAVDQLLSSVNRPKIPVHRSRLESQACGAAHDAKQSAVQGMSEAGKRNVQTRL